ETPPHFWGHKEYPARWWKQQDPNFFPKWQWWLDRPLPEGWDPLFERGAYQDSLFNDAVLPAQYAATATLGQSERALAEKRMLMVMLDDARTAVESYLRDRAAGRRLCHARRFAEDWEWFFSDDEEAPFSFLNVCFWTQSDPVSIRTELLAYEQVLERERLTQTPARQEVETALHVRALRQKKVPLPDLVVAVESEHVKRVVTRAPYGEPRPPLPPCPGCHRQEVGLCGRCGCGRFLLPADWLPHYTDLPEDRPYAWDGQRWHSVDLQDMPECVSLYFPRDVAYKQWHGPGIFALPPADARLLLLGSGGVRFATLEECGP